MTEIRACKMCQGEAWVTFLDEDGESWAAFCKNAECETKGPTCSTEAGAVAKWNHLNEPGSVAAWKQGVAAGLSVIDHQWSIGNASMADAYYAIDILRPPASLASDGLDAQKLEIAIGGAYELPDGRKFWMDVQATREVCRRIIAALNPNRRKAVSDNVKDFPAPPKQSDLLIGPFQEWRVVVEGRMIPGLTGFHDGDKIALVLDGRWSASFSEPDARQVAWLLANALAIGQGYPGLCAEKKEMPFAPQCSEILTGAKA